MRQARHGERVREEAVEGMRYPRRGRSQYDVRTVFGLFGVCGGEGEERSKGVRGDAGCGLRRLFSGEIWFGSRCLVSVLFVRLVFWLSLIVMLY